MALNEFETEDQQIEALKKWWKENGTSIVIGLVVGVSALFGWRTYVAQNHEQAVYASDLYMQVVQSAMINAVDDKTIDIHNRLINEFSDTPYAALASLMLARSEYEKDNVEGTVAQLELAKKYAVDDVIKHIANLRLASVFLEQKKYDQAIVLLNEKHDAAFDAQYEELKGDVYFAKGDVAQARLAYDKALSLQGIAASQWLKLKRQNLGRSSSQDISAVNMHTKAVNL